MTEENGIPTRTDLADIPEQTPEDERKRDEVEECMRDVIDPELGINVVDLGLVYRIWIENGVDAHIEMTLTSPACPLTDAPSTVSRAQLTELHLRPDWKEEGKA